MRVKMQASEAAEFLGISPPSLTKKIAAKNVGHKIKRSGTRAYLGHAVCREIFDLEWKFKVIAWQVVKGGTGKTTLAHEVACCANLFGARVLMVDLDQQGSLTLACGVDMINARPMIHIIRDETDPAASIVNISEGLDLLPSNLLNAELDYFLRAKSVPVNSVYRDIFDSLKDKYDLIIVDCPPALGASVAAASLAAECVIMPIEPDALSMSGLDVSMRELAALEKRHKRKIEKRVLLNKFDSITALSESTLRTLYADSALQPILFVDVVRHCQDFPNQMAKAESVFGLGRQSAARDDIIKLTKSALGISNPKAQKSAVNA